MAKKKETTAPAQAAEAEAAKQEPAQAAAPGMASAAAADEIPEVDPGQKAELIKQFNDAFGEFAEILDEPADEQWIQDVKKAHDDLVNNINSRVYRIGNEDTAKFIAEFLYKFNQTANCWVRDAWRGVIKFNEVITEKLAQIIKGEQKVLELAFPELVFAYNSLMNPQGRGLESAKIMEEFETESDARPLTWSQILDHIGEHIDWIQFINKKVWIYNQRVAFAWNGLKLNIKCAEDAEYVRLYEAMNNQK